jgi:FKBP-type peptidyl-prolyl cis-trans isomerase FkpA
MKLISIIIIAAAVGCGDRQGRVPTDPRPAPTQEDLIQRNKDALRQEERDIDRFVKRSGLPFLNSPRGVRYVILRDRPGAPVLPDQWVTIHYRVELLSGDTAYSTAANGPESFLVERDDVESGLHEAVQLLSPGDSAVFIMPSFRAHGLTGDQDRIPMRSSLVYRVGLVKAVGAPR